MSLHRDIYWLGRQWAVTGYGIQAVDQRRFGADHDEADGMLRAEIDHRAMIGQRHVVASRMLGDSGVAGDRMQAIEARRLRELPGERMFAAPGPQQQDVHARPLRR